MIKIRIALADKPVGLHVLRLVGVCSSSACIRIDSDAHRRKDFITREVPLRNDHRRGVFFRLLTVLPVASKTGQLTLRAELL